MLKYLNILKLFNANATPSHLAFSSTVGLFLGLYPSTSILLWVILVFTLFLRFNPASLAVFWLLGETIAIIAHPIISQFGEYLLNNYYLQSLWQSFYNQLIWRLFDFNQTYILSISLMTLFLFVPIFLLLIIFYKGLEKNRISRFFNSLTKIPFLNLFISGGKNTKKISFVKRWLNIPRMITMIIVIGISSFITIYYNGYSFKNLLEEKLTNLLDAPVSIGLFNVSFNPIGFTLNDFIIKQDAETSKQALNIGELSFAVNLFHLNSRRLVFDAITFSNIKANLKSLSQLSTNNNATTNNSSIRSTNSFTDGLSFPTLPSVQEILANEKLITIKQSQELSDKKDSLIQYSETLKDRLPSANQFDKYKKQLAELKKTNLSNIAGNAKKLNNLKDNINQQLKKFDDINNNIDKQIKSVVTSMRVLSKAPDNDWHNIEEKYKINKQQKGNLLNMILGDNANQWFNMASLAYQTLKPLINNLSNTEKTKPPIRNFGSYITFTENDPQPSFNIKKLNAKSTINHWHLELNNINIKQKESQLATTGTLHFELNRTSPLKAHLIFDHRLDEPINELRLKNNNITVSNHEIIDNENLSMILKEAKETIDMQFNLKDSGLITGYWYRNFIEIQWDFKKMEQAKGNLLRPGIFEKIKDFDSKIEVSSSISSPKLNFSSNLDDRLLSVLLQSRKNSLIDLKRKVKKNLTQQASNSLEQTRLFLTQFKKQQNSIAKDKKRWQNELSKKLPL